MIVVDASVALAWVLPDTEERHQYAGSVAAAQRLGGQKLLAPVIFTAECSYQLLKLGRARRWGSAKIEEYAEVIGIFMTELRAIEPSLASQVRFANRFNVQGYDALYLALALETGAELATLDNGLRNAAKAAGAKLWA